MTVPKIDTMRVPLSPGVRPYERDGFTWTCSCGAVGLGRYPTEATARLAAVASGNAQFHMTTCPLHDGAAYMGHGVEQGQEPPPVPAPPPTGRAVRN